MAFDVYQTVTDRIVELLEQGTVPWRLPYRGGSGESPMNLKSGKPYRGVNVFLLGVEAWNQGYESAYWLTFKQAQQRGGSVRKGEKSTLVVFWKQLQIEDEDEGGGEAKTVPVLRYFRVFNVDQCEGIDAPGGDDHEPLDFTPIEAAQRIVEGYQNGPTVETGSSHPCYVPGQDLVRMPSAERFVGEGEFYSTLFHELAHSTGHSRRLNRGLDTKAARFGSETYGKEELVAEMAAAFLCGNAGIERETVGNSAAYIGNWLKKIRKDKKLIVHAAGAGQRATDWILGRYRPGTGE